MAAQREWLSTDFYAILAVEPTATPDEIKKGYRKLAQKFHPDNNPGNTRAEERFKQVSEAYTVLGDPEQRREYDEMRRLGASGGFGAPGGARGPMGGFGGDGDLNDLLRTIFAAGGNEGVHQTYGGRPRPRKGMDLRADVHLSFEDALAGVKTKLRISGDGDSKELTVRLPGGVADGQVVRVASRGGPGLSGGPAGDVLVHVHVERHPLFMRRGDDVLLEVPVSFSEAVLGTSLRVPLPDGATTTFKLAPGTPSAKTFRLRGKGAPGKGSKVGDLLVTVAVKVPSKPSRQVKDLIEQLAEHDDFKERDASLFPDDTVRSTS
ncbi:MAG: molecular chaperone DnaJ [Glaciecola sp.]|jgi:molecular chaperone DnaJ